MLVRGGWEEWLVDDGDSRSGEEFVEVRGGRI